MTSGSMFIPRCEEHNETLNTEKVNKRYFTNKNKGKRGSLPSVKNEKPVLICRSGANNID